MNITDTQVEQSCDILRKAINAAENSNHAGEVFVVAAANATALVEALEWIAENDQAGPTYFEQRNGRDCPAGNMPGKFAERARTALTLAKGGRV